MNLGKVGLGFHINAHVYENVRTLSVFVHLR
jgi:hypothetical protein